MGLVNFSQLLEDDEWLGKGKIPMHSDLGRIYLGDRLLNNTNTLFIDVAFLLTSGRDMKFGTEHPFMYDTTDTDANNFRKQKDDDRELAANDPAEYKRQKALRVDEPPVKLSYPPLTLSNIADYMISFMNRLFKSRRSLQNIVFGVDNHVHVPITKLREWNARDYGSVGTYESAPFEFREQMRAPFSRSDEAFITNLINLLEDGKHEDFDLQILGLTFTRASPKLDAFLTDRYVRPYFISLLFRLVYERLQDNMTFDKDVSVFVMHPIFDFGTLESNRVDFAPNFWKFSKGELIDKLSDDALYIGEADIQMLWLLETKLKNKPVVVEVFSDDSDNVMILLNYYIRQAELGNNNVARVFLWNSDERCMRMKYLYESVIPAMINNKNLHDRVSILDQNATTINNNKIFVELCMAFFKNDYYDDLQGTSATIPKLKNIVNTLSKISDKSSIGFRGNRCFTYAENKIVFNHLNLMRLRQVIALCLLLKPELKKDTAEVKNSKNEYNKLVMGLLTGPRNYLNSVSGIFAPKQFDELVNGFDLPIAIKEAIVSKKAEILSKVLYMSQMEAHLQYLCTAFVENNKAYDVFGKDMHNLKKCEPSREKLYFMRLYDETPTVTFIDREVRDRGEAGIFYQTRRENDGSIADRQKCQDVNFVNSLMAKINTVFFGEFSPISLSQFASMFEWVMVYWTVGYFPCFSKQHLTLNPIDNEKKSFSSINIAFNTENDDSIQMNKLLVAAGYNINQVSVNPNDENKQMLTKLRRNFIFNDTKQITTQSITVTIDANTKQKNKIDVNVTDMSTCIKRSGMLLLSNSIAIVKERLTPEETFIIRALINLAKTDLFRILNMTEMGKTNSGSWIDMFYSVMMQHGAVYEDRREGIRKVIYPDEQLALKKTLFMLFYNDEKNESRPFDEPPTSYIIEVKRKQGGVSSSSRGSSSSSSSGGATSSEDSITFMVPTFFINNFESVIKLNVSNSNMYGEFRKTRNSSTLKTFKTQREQMMLCERDILGEFDTAFFSGLVMATDKHYDPDNPNVPSLGQLSRRSMSLPKCKLMSSAHPIVGGLITQAMHNLMSQSSGDDGFSTILNTIQGFMISSNNAQDNGDVLSHNIDVNVYALPLVKLSVAQNTWMESVSNNVYMFRRPMEAAFYAFMNWKLNQSTYLRYCQTLGIRNNKTQHWRTNSYYLVMFMKLSQPDDVQLNNVSVRDATKTRIDKIKDAISSNRGQMHACWPMAYLQYVNKIDLLETMTANADELNMLLDFDKNILLRMLTIYFPTCVNLYLSINLPRNEAGEIVQGLPEIRLLFKNWPDNLMFHYILYCFFRLFSVFVAPRSKKITFKDYLRDPFLPLRIDNRTQAFVIKILYN